MQGIGRIRTSTTGPLGRRSRWASPRPALQPAIVLLYPPVRQPPRLCQRMLKRWKKIREETDRVLTDDGWFYSGDLCVMDEAGNIRIVGRKKDMIVRGGENLNSNYIDEALEGCPGVADHAVIGMPDERLGERICAYVVPEQGVCVGLDQVV